MRSSKVERVVRVEGMDGGGNEIVNLTSLVLLSQL